MQVVVDVVDVVVGDVVNEVDSNDSVFGLVVDDVVAVVEVGVAVDRQL